MHFVQRHLEKKLESLRLLLRRRIARCEDLERLDPCRLIVQASKPIRGGVDGRVHVVDDDAVDADDASSILTLPLLGNRPQEVVQKRQPVHPRLYRRRLLRRVQRPMKQEQPLVPR